MASHPSRSRGPVPPVLVVGAGPTGLLMSLWLTKYKVPHRIIDKHTTTGQTSRAIVAHSRTFEFYRMLDIDQDILDLSVKFGALQVSSNGKPKGRIAVGDAGIGKTYFPAMYCVTQDEHEEVLQRKLHERGQEVERAVEMVRMQFPQDDSSAEFPTVTIRPIDGSSTDEEIITASYVIGCDGAHSAVRHATGIEMRGGTYDRAFFVADVFCHGDMQTQGQLNMCLSTSGFVIVLPLPHKENRARIVGFAPKQDPGSELREVKFEDCLPNIKAAAPGLHVDEVRWFATYRVHHRCADDFQFGKRVFLCGDAAHLHSPVGGQGMNTGLGDASNLAWKIAVAWHAAAKSESLDRADSLLSTYNVERRRFAARLVNSNDRLFQFIIQQNPFGWLLRNFIMPYVMPFIANTFNLKPHLYGMVSQTAIEYSPSALSEGNGNKALAGMRLPWMEQPGGAAGKDDNHALLDGAGWQAHVFGNIGKAEKDVLVSADVPIHLFPSTQTSRSQGFKTDTTYLLRPDGYIGLVLEAQTGSKQALEDYIRQWHVGRLP